MAETYDNPEINQEQSMAFIAYQHARSWQTVFDELTDHSQAANLRKQAISELDAMFPYKGERVYMSGNGKYLTLDPATNIPVKESWQYIKGCECLHNGFAVLETNESGSAVSYHVMQQVYTGFRRGKISDNVYQTLQFFDYFDLDSSCLVAKELDDIFYETDESLTIDDQIGVVHSRSHLLDALIQSTAFRRMNRTKQQNQVANLISQAEQDVKIRGTSLLAEAEYGYINFLGNYVHILPVDIRDSVIGGVCLGLESLESLALREKAIRRNANLVDKKAGICLVLDPDPDTRQGLLLEPEQLLYVPTYQKLHVEEVSK
jgi:hypothetical protein